MTFDVFHSEPFVVSYVYITEPSPSLIKLTNVGYYHVREYAKETLAFVDVRLKLVYVETPRMWDN